MKCSARCLPQSLLVASLLATGLLLVTSAVPAEMCTLDTVPAATLLLPYFEVDLAAAPGKGVNTVFTIHNALPDEALAHVSFWTDWSQPVLDFDVFLTGYDVQTIDLYDVLVNGNLPVTADEQSDQGQDGGRASDLTSSCDGTVDSCSPHGNNPGWDGSFPQTSANAAISCLDIFPFFVNPLLSESLIANVQTKLLGQPIDGACFGADYGDSLARGYITIDNVRACSLIFPSEAEYFAGGGDSGIASNINQLWGDWYFLDPGNTLTLSRDPLVHIEASEEFDADSTPTGSTFYGRYTQAYGTQDHREPLVGTWGFNYRNAAPTQITDLVVWRDSTSNDQNFDGYPCGSGPGAGPAGYPLGQVLVECFNQAEEVVELCNDQECFPLESQRLEFDAGNLSVPFEAGWCRVDLSATTRPINRSIPEPPAPPAPVAQSWVGATFHASGILSSGLSALALDSICNESSVASSVFAQGGTD